MTKSPVLAYDSETMMYEIKESCSPDAYRAFDTHYYREGNACLVAAGKIAQRLVKDDFCSLFVMLPGDIKEYLSRFHGCSE